jgi:hypothetical protein
MNSAPDRFSAQVFLRLAALGSWLLLAGYFYRLASRTAFFQRTAAVGGDVVVIVASMCIFACALSVILVLMGRAPRALDLVLLFGNAIALAVYGGLYFFGKFGPIVTG